MCRSACGSASSGSGSHAATPWSARSVRRRRGSSRSTVPRAGLYGSGSASRAMLPGMPPVQLFATCLGDLVLPDAVRDAESLLREAGFDVEIPGEQVCCGQPAFNSGHRGPARRVARTFVRAFSRGAPVVVPSGSCATMAARFLPELVGCEPFDVWELSAFLDAQGVEPQSRNEGRRVVYPDSCHMLR